MVWYDISITITISNRHFFLGAMSMCCVGLVLLLILQFNNNTNNNSIDRTPFFLHLCYTYTHSVQMSNYF